MVAHQIEKRGVRSPIVLAAMRSVPRHEFVPEDRRHQSYGDHPVPIGEGQTISQPYMVAAMTEILDLTDTTRVLEIGTGCGYQTAVLAEIAGSVLTIERISVLAARARTRLTALGYGNIDYRVCDGTRGWPEEAPFDAILITAAAPRIPPSLLDQLRDPGVLVAPVGDAGMQDLVSVRRKGGRDDKKVHFRCTFVPLVGEEGFSH